MGPGGWGQAVEGHLMEEAGLRLLLRPSSLLEQQAKGKERKRKGTLSSMRDRRGEERREGDAKKG